METGILDTESTRVSGSMGIFHGQGVIWACYFKAET